MPSILSTPIGIVFLLGALLFALLAGSMWRRRRSVGAIALGLMLLAGVEYCVTYALELASLGVRTKELWGDLKYLGICLLPLAWLAFTLQYTGRTRWLRAWVFALLSIEPLAVLGLLADGATRHLIHVYPAPAAFERFPIVQFGPVGWFNAIYMYLLLLATTVLFIATLLRISRLYRRPALVLIAALVIPWVLNILYNFDVGPFGRIDATPAAFLAAMLVLVWGIFGERLLEIVPVARKLVFQRLNDGVVVLDAFRRVVELNDAAMLMLGTAMSQAVSRPMDQLLPGSGDALDRAYAGDPGPWEVRLGDPGEEHEYEMTVAALSGSERRASGAIVVLRDMSERKRGEEQLREAESRYRALVERVPAVVYIDMPQDHDRTIYVSPQIQSLLGLSPKAYVEDPELWLKHVHPADRDRAMAEYYQGLARGRPFASEYRMVRPDGEIVWVHDEVVILKEGPDGPELVQGIMIDVTDLKEAQERAAFLAYHDSLTELPNRTMFEDSVHLALARARRGGLAVAVLYIDLDNFKLVNDSLGHAAGDELLRQVALRLRRAARETDLLARQGGDEFLLLLADLPPSRRTGRHDALAVAEAVATRIEKELVDPFVVAGTECYVSASTGVSLFPEHGEDVITLLRNADAAMYRSKRARPGGHAVFATSGQDAGSLLSLATRLHKAVEQNQWVLHYQPIVDMKSMRTLAVEALVRWRVPHGELLGPTEFIPLAEEMGLIGAIGEWVFRELCEQASAWRGQGVPLDVSVNVSPRELWHPHFVDNVASRLAATGVPARSVIVEITESTAMSDPDRTQRVIQGLTEVGVRIAIDDFGTGYSSLSRLTSMPVDILKIDRPFIRRVPGDRQARKMATTILQLARSLGMEPLAEGIETPEQASFMLAEGCSLGQGYFLGRPTSAAQVAARCVRERGGADAEASSGTPNSRRTPASAAANPVR